MLDTGSSEGHFKEEKNNDKSFLESKAYICTIILLSLAYFFNVFIGLFLINEDTIAKDINKLNSYKITDHLYDIIEVSLLGIFLLECIFKILYTNKASRKNSNIGLKEVSIDSSLTLFAIALFVISIFTRSLLIFGFLRMRCIFKFPYVYMVIISNC